MSELERIIHDNSNGLDYILHIILMFMILL